MSQQINLFNPIFRKQKKYFSAVTMAQALGMTLLGALILAGYLNYRSLALKQSVEASAAQLAAANAQLAQIDEVLQRRQKDKQLEDELKKAEADKQALHQVFEVLKKGDLGNTKGYSEYFRAVSRQIVPGVWLTGFSIQGAGNDIGMQGRTLQPQLVPEFLSRLKQEEVMKGKSFATLEMQMPKPISAGAQGVSPQSNGDNHIEFILRGGALVKSGADSTGGQGK